MKRSYGTPHAIHKVLKVGTHEIRVNPAGTRPTYAIRTWCVPLAALHHPPIHRTHDNENSSNKINYVHFGVARNVTSMRWEFQQIVGHDESSKPNDTLNIIYEPESWYAFSFISQLSVSNDANTTTSQVVHTERTWTRQTLQLISLSIIVRGTRTHCTILSCDATARDHCKLRTPCELISFATSFSTVRSSLRRSSSFNWCRCVILSAFS